MISCLQSQRNSPKGHWKNQGYNHDTDKWNLHGSRESYKCLKAGNNNNNKNTNFQTGITVDWKQWAALPISQMVCKQWWLGAILKPLRKTKSYQANFPSYSDRRQITWSVAEMMFIDSKKHSNVSLLRSLQVWWRSMSWIVVELARFVSKLLIGVRNVFSNTTQSFWLWSCWLNHKWSG